MIHPVFDKIAEYPGIISLNATSLDRREDWSIGMTHISEETFEEFKEGVLNYMQKTRIKDQPVQYLKFEHTKGVIWVASAKANYLVIVGKPAVDQDAIESMLMSVV